MLEIDLDAIAENWRRLNRLSPGAETAAVVKANAYGAGIERTAPALWRAGARTFFVATVGEALSLRALLPEARIFCLGGLCGGPPEPSIEAGIRPVLNAPHEIDAWPGGPAALHLDTGMTRLGLDPADDAEVDLARVDLELVISHLVSAEARDDPLNEIQRQRFDRRRRRFEAPASLANSSGHFLGAGFRFALTRPGVALYGANPTPGEDNPMRPVVRLSAPILQIHEVDAPGSVGYGAAHAVDAGDRIATVGVGYADGYPRCAGGRSWATLRGERVPVVGRVSMDLITLDVTAVPSARPGDSVELLGEGWSVDELASASDTIAYEILTRLGSRIERRYVEGGA